MSDELPTKLPSKSRQIAKTRAPGHRPTRPHDNKTAYKRSREKLKTKKQFENNE